MMGDSSRLASIIQLLINFSVYLFFIFYIFNGKMKRKGYVSGLVAGGYVVISIIFIETFMLNKSIFRQYAYFALVIWLVATVLISMFMLKSNLIQLLFLIFTIMELQLNIINISQIIYDIDLFPHISGSNDMQFLLINTFVLIIFLPAMWYLFIHLFKKVIDCQIDKSCWNYLFFVPISAYLYCVYFSMNYPVENSPNPIHSLIMLLLLNIMSFLSYIAVLQMLVKASDSIIATQKAAIAEQQILIQNEQYKKLAENINRTNRMQHDMRHHFIAIRGYLENSDYDKATGYINSFLGKQLSSNEARICEKHSVDMILRHYISLAKEYGIDVETSIVLPESYKISDTDLCIIFGNLVENAVEGCQRQISGDKFISIKVRIMNDDMLIITVSNSHDGSIIECDDGFISQKHSGIGIGTSSVKNIVERNGGTCKFSVEKNVFKVCVLLIS